MFKDLSNFVYRGTVFGYVYDFDSHDCYRWCTGAPVHRCTSASVHQCTGSPVGRSKQLADCPLEKHLSAVLETDTCNQNVPITSQPGNLLTPSALPATELQPSSASTDQVFPLESFVPTSPGAEISMDVDLLQEIATCDYSGNRSLTPLAITYASFVADTTTNTTTYSALQPVQTSYNFLPSVPSFDVLT